MTIYYKEIDGVWTPYTDKQLRNDNPNMSFPRELTEAILDEYGMVLAVEPDPIPTPEFNQNIKKSENPVMVDGVLTHNYIVSDKSEEEMTRNYVAAIDELLYQKAQEHGYDSINNACSYAAYTNPFQTESQKFIEWRGNVWETGYTIMDEVRSGVRTLPTIEQVLSELPTLNLT